MSRNYLYPHERRSLIILMLLGTILFSANQWIIPFFKGLPKTEVFRTGKSQQDTSNITIIEPVSSGSKSTYILSFRSEDIEGGYPKSEQPDGKIEKKEIKLNQVSQRSVDPNTAEKETFESLGLSDFAIQNLIKYRSAGGNFSSTNDLLKIYGIDSSVLVNIEPYLLFEESFFTSKRSSQIPKMSIDLNNCTTGELEQVKGLGPVFSERIVKYRELLGGFSSTDQLKEVYGLSPETFDQIVGNFDISQIRKKIKINALDVKGLARHPYIDWSTAKVILRYREEHGPFQSPMDLQNVKILEDTMINKLTPYLDFSLQSQNISL